MKKISKKLKSILRHFLGVYEASMDNYTAKPPKGCQIALKWALMGCLCLVGCGTIKEVPITTAIETQIQYIDSLRIKDSTVIHTASVVKDYAVDTLVLQGQHSNATAYLDTTAHMLKGSLREDAWKERIIYKDRIVYRDSLITKEVEVPVEVVKEVELTKIPFFYRLCTLITCLIAFYFIWKLVMKIYVKN